MPKQSNPEDDDMSAETGRRIAELRKLKRLTQRRLADLSGVDPQTISRLENGRQTLSGTTLRGLVRELETTADYLLLGVHAGRSMTLSPACDDPPELRKFTDQVTLAGDELAWLRAMPAGPAASALVYMSALSAYRMAATRDVVAAPAKRSTLAAPATPIVESAVVPVQTPAEKPATKRRAR